MKIYRWLEIWELVYPYLLGAVTAISIVVCALTGRVAIPATFRDLCSGTLNVSAISVGFLATTKAIVLSLDDNRRIIRYLKEARRYDITMGFFLSAIRWGFATAIISALMLLIDPKAPPAHLPFFVGGWIFFSVTSAAMCYRVIGVLAQLVPADPPLRQ